MATRGKIDQLYDLEKIAAQQKEVVGYVDEFVRRVSNTKPIRIQLEGAEKTKDVVKGMNELQLNMREYGKLADQAAAAQARLNAMESEHARKLAEVKIQQAVQNKAQQEALRDTLGLTGAYEKLSREHDNAAKKAKDLAAQYGAGSIEAKTASAAVQEYASKLAEIQIQQQEQNKLQKDAARDALGLTDAYEKLTREYNAAAKEAKNLAVQFGANSKQAKEASARTLELDGRLKAADANVGRFNKNVGNYSAALKILEKSLDGVRTKIDQNSKSGSQNADVVAQLRKEEELLNQLLNSQVNGFVTATAEVKENTRAIQQLEKAGLKGTEVYHQLFAATADLKDETSDLKTALKNAAPDDVAFNAAADAARGLIGVYGLAKSVSAAFGFENEALQETMVKLQAAETALQSIEAIRAVFKKENAVRQAINIGLQKIETLQTILQSAAESKNIVVKYAAAAAQSVLNAVMMANPILLVIGGLTALTVLLVSFTSGTDKARVSFEALNNSLDDNIKVDNKRIDNIKRNSDSVQSKLESEFATSKKLSDARIRFLKSEAKVLKERDDEYAATGAAAAVRLKQEEKGIKKLTDEERTGAQAIVATLEDLRSRRADLNVQIQSEQNSQNRKNIEENAKANQEIIEASKLQLQDSAAIKQDIINDDRKSFAERIAALKEFGKIQSQIIRADAEKQLSTPGQTKTQRDLIRAQAKASQDELNRSIAKQNEDLRRQELEREKRAQFEIAKISIETRAAALDKIANDENKSQEDRLSAAYAFQQAQESVIIGQKNLELQSATLSATERVAIEEKANADIIASKIAFTQKAQEIILQELDEENRHRVEANNRERDLAIVALNDRFNSGKINLAKYNRERLDLEKGYSIESLQIEIENAKKVLKSHSDLGYEVSAEEAKVAELQKNLSDEVTNKKIDNLQKLKEKEKQLSEEIFNTVQTIVIAGYDREKNAIQSQIDALDRKAAKDIEVANAQAGTEEEKAARITAINIRAQRQKEVLEQRQRQIDIQRARFEKAASIARIIADTAQAVIAALTSKPPNVPLSISVGTIGALQLAQAFTAQVPAFAEGTDDAEGGLSLVGDGGKKEIVIEPTGKTYITPAKKTLMNIPKHSVVLPDADAVMKGMELAAMSNMVKALNYPVTEQSYGKSMTQALENGFDRLANVVANKKELHIKPGFNSLMAMHKFGSRWVQYVEEQTNF